MIKRHLEDSIEKWLFRQKVIIVYGARQTGKTTLVKKILNQHGDSSGYFDCERLTVRQAFESCEPEKIKKYIGNHKIVVFDEAQQINDIGRVLKVFHDAYPDIQIVATGSSSFELANRTQEFLTGRGLEFILYPFSYSELVDTDGMAKVDSRKEFYMLYGTYPEICLSSEEDARILLDNLTGKYLYKDILEFENIKKPDKLLKLLKLLAYQIGNEVSLHELTTALGVNRDTVERYLDLLEKAFVIFRLKAFSKNLRKEINKKEKIFFYDVGIRNSLISRFDDIGMRDDIGGLWENLCIVERKKYLQKTGRVCGQYFWRTHDRKEIDYLEQENGNLHGYEFKYRKKNVKIPKEFLDVYEGSRVDVVDSENWWDFVV